MSRFFWVANVLFRLSCNSPFPTKTTLLQTSRQQKARWNETNRAKLSNKQTVYFQKVRLLLDATDLVVVCSPSCR